MNSKVVSSRNTKHLSCQVIKMLCELCSNAAKNMAYKRVRANKGAAGVDGQSIAGFETDLKDNLYKIWNRMSSGSYLPPSVLRVEIPKDDGRMRPLGIPTVADRVAQQVVKQYLEPGLERCFHPNSYGYRPGKSALDAVGQARKNCWKYDWVMDLDIKEELIKRMTEVGLELHPEKTKIVYCKDADRPGDFLCTSFDFLGYTFRSRRSKNRWGKFFINFTPAISNKASKAIRQTSRRWHWPERSDKDLEDLSQMFNPIIQGWINYYGRYYKSALYPTLRCLDRRLVMWATRKYKRLRCHRRRAAHWLDRIARKQPNLFAHWRLLYAGR